MVKILKIAAGSMMAIMFAELLGLEYAVSAGIITLLTIQDTAKETINISLKRICAFLFASGLAYVLFTFLGHHVWVFGLFLLIFVSVCSRFDLKDAIAMNSVLTTHYLLYESITPAVFVNELLLLAIGAGIGTLLNLYMPGDVKRIRKTQHELEEDLRTILFRMSKYIVSEDKTDYTGECFKTIDLHIQNGLKYAYANMNNRFLQETQYFIDYMQMRKQQAAVLHGIYEKIVAMQYIPPQAEMIAEFIEHISKTFAESNNAKSLTAECEQLCEKFKMSELPNTRHEFEARAILYLILLDLKNFINIKGEFAESLTEKQIEKYWN